MSSPLTHHLYDGGTPGLDGRPPGLEEGVHRMEITSSVASWIGGWEGGGDDDGRRCILSTGTSSVATVLCGLSWMVKVKEMLSVVHPLSGVFITTEDG